MMKPPDIDLQDRCPGIADNGADSRADNVAKRMQRVARIVEIRCRFLGFAEDSFSETVAPGA